jgi:lysozyme family protein
MASFDKAIPFTLKHEGGYVWHPADPGGETNRGITDGLDGNVDGLADVDGDGDGDILIQELSEAQAKEIYKRRFWDKMHGDDIKSQNLANILFDGYVNMGGNAIKLMQRELMLKEDGVLGPVTLRGINGYNPRTLFEQYKAARIDYYLDLANRKPALKIFLKGWLNRINSFNWNESL